MFQLPILQRLFMTTLWGTKLNHWNVHALICRFILLFRNLTMIQWWYLLQSLSPTCLEHSWQNTRVMDTMKIHWKFRLWQASHTTKDWWKHLVRCLHFSMKRLYPGTLPFLSYFSLFQQTEFVWWFHKSIRLCVTNCILLQPSRSVCPKVDYKANQRVLFRWHTHPRQRIECDKCNLFEYVWCLMLDGVTLISFLLISAV